MGDHSLLSPSACSRWSSCTGSTMLIKHLLDNNVVEEKQSVYATIGHEKHEEMERFLKKNTDLFKDELYKTNNKLCDIIHDESQYPAIHFLNIVRYISGIVSNNSYIHDKHIESKLSIPLDTDISVFGTADLILEIEESPLSQHIFIIDYKFGAGIAVSAYKNKQLMLYAYGFYHLMRTKFHFNNYKIHLLIYSPNSPTDTVFSHYETSLAEILSFIKEINLLLPNIEAGKGFNPTASNCQFCLAKNHCDARKELVTTLNNLQEKNDKFFNLVLSHGNDIIKLVKDTQEEIKQSMLEGHHYDGYKLIETKGRRSWKNNAVSTLKSTFGDDVVKESPIGITELKKRFKDDYDKDLLETIINDNTEIKGGGYKVVKSSDKGVDVNSIDPEMLED